MHHLEDPAMQHCIQDCFDSQRVCLETAMHQCLEAGGEHVSPPHFRLLMACSAICGAAGRIMVIGVPQHAAVCAACAEICQACAQDCERIGGMEECVAVCRACAASCTAMAGDRLHAAAADSVA